MGPTALTLSPYCGWQVFLGLFRCSLAHSASLLFSGEIVFLWWLETWILNEVFPERHAQRDNTVMAPEKHHLEVEIKETYICCCSERNMLTEHFVQVLLDSVTCVWRKDSRCEEKVRKPWLSKWRCHIETWDEACCRGLSYIWAGTGKLTMKPSLFILTLWVSAVIDLFQQENVVFNNTHESLTLFPVCHNHIVAVS